MTERGKTVAGPRRGSAWGWVFHGLLAVLGWILFGYFWRVVMSVGLSAGARTALFAMVLFLAALLLLTTWWIAHNVRVARRDRRRGNPNLVEKLYIFDTCGMRVEMPDHARLKTASVIEITIDGTHKTYRAIVEGRSDKSATV